VHLSCLPNLSFSHRLILNQQSKILPPSLPSTLFGVRPSVCARPGATRPPHIFHLRKSVLHLDNK
jgi:hypothetical protein